MKLESKYFSGIILFLLLFTVVPLVSCDKNKTKIDQPKTAEVTFSVDWSGVKSPNEVQTASIYLYPEPSGNHIELKGVSAEKVTTEVAEGTYRVIVYNENLSIISMRNPQTYSSFEAYVNVANRETVIENGPKTVIPSLENLHILTGTANRELAVIGGEASSVVLRPKTVTSSYRFTINIPTKLQFSAVSAVLGGVASRLSLFEAKPLASDISSVDVPLTQLKANSTSDTLKANGVVETFGVDPANRNAGSNTLYLHLTPVADDADLKKDYQIDLTSFFDSYNNINLDIDIRVDSPDPVNPDAVQFTVTVRPWIIDDGGHVDLEPEESLGVGRMVKK